MSRDQYTEMLKLLLPPGDALRAPDGSNLHQLLDGFAEEYTLFDARTADLLDEALPDSTTELIDDWERIAGLPGNCSPQLETIEERRAALVGKLTNSGGHSLQVFLDHLDGAGIDATITLDHGFRLGLDGMGDGLGGTDWNYVWHVNVSEPTSPVSQQLECLFDEIKPAHTVVHFNYEEA